MLSNFNLKKRPLPSSQMLLSRQGLLLRGCSWSWMLLGREEDRDSYRVMTGNSRWGCGDYRSQGSVRRDISLERADSSRRCWSQQWCWSWSLEKTAGAGFFEVGGRHPRHVERTGCWADCPERTLVWGLVRRRDANASASGGRCMR